jgi:Acyl-CoA dehydrogenase, C-terminal domain
MDLRWSQREEEFRAEGRAWLEANVPRDLPSGNTRAGFAAHVDWERTLVAVEFARPAVLAAAWAQAAGAPDAAAQVSAAKVLASDAARLVARTALQCHGAIGYTTEYDLHLYAKRAWALIPAWGSPDWHRARLATYLGVSDG